ncbi:histone acetyltransferase KAT6B-like [Anneissia japonica]|uniref:histone acetyltransferase KAT6B-like n=1 Tax=Anneissia japonica TaxID=1529436 RepID=UPI00142582F1|nr:histone acetyltransferase KAT6B-like [Anneissia japonica]
MSEIKYQDAILETIDSLRRRKARPGIERIYHMLQRKNGVTLEEVESALEHLVEAEIVVKVEYKGSTSYRNAAKWRKSHVSGNILNSTDVTRTLIAAIKALGEEKEGATDGASLCDIEKFLVTKNPQSKMTKRRLTDALMREVDIGRVALHDNKYRLVARTITEAGSFRPLKPSKRKRIKKTHGPDFHHEPIGRMGDPRCDYCTLTAKCNRYGLKEDLLICKDCSAKAHPSCMNYSAELAERSRRFPWQCIDCKTCSVCDDAGNADTLLFCDACDKGYHMVCHNPPVLKKPLGKWVCEVCIQDDDLILDHESSSSDKMDDDLQSTDIDSVAASPDSMITEDSQISMQVDDSLPMKEIDASCSSTDSNINKGISTVLPEGDARPSEWDINQVVNYFHENGFSDQALAFQEQEIDGKSLLLLKRSDVLTGLALKLGPALKIYQHVAKLQTQPDLPGL